MKEIKNIISILILIVLALGVKTVAAQSTTWKAPEKADTLENPLEKNERILKAGKQIFDQLCAVCHGKTGKGDGVTAATLKPKPADLTGNTVQAQTDGALYWKISEGRPPMPPFKSQLNDKQVWALVTYIRSLNIND